MDTRIELLGKLQVQQAGRTITRFRTYKTGVLLAYLAFYPDREHPREQLIELLWPECEPAQGRNSLSQALSSLRNQLEPPGVPAGTILLADRAAIRLNPQAFETDVAEFETDLRKSAYEGAHSADGQIQNPKPVLSGANGSKVQNLLSAIDCYTGELLPGFYEDWVLKERERLLEAYLRALDQLQAHWEATGNLARAIDCARKAIDADPLREQSHADLIRLYAASGERSAAARQYQELERLLEKQLGVSPDPSLRALLDDAAPATVRLAELPSRDPAPQSAAPELPAGIVTFLLADPPVAAKDSLREQITRYRGLDLRATPEMGVAAFARASDAVECAAATARSQQGESRFRLALITAEAEVSDREGRLSDRQLLHCMRLLAAAHPGQVLCAEATAALLRRDLDPGVRLADLGVFRLEGEDAPERLFEIEYPGRPQISFPPPLAPPGFAGNLPVQLTHFFGRRAEIDRLTIALSRESGVGSRESRVESREPVGGSRESGGEYRGTGGDGSRLSTPDSRLITITGPGGTGKTRLSLEVARRLMESYRGAVWFVPLADITEPQLIPKAILDALGIPAAPLGDPLLQVTAALSRQPTLLVLDNFEQLLSCPACARQSAQIVRALLECVPDLTCLASSRRLIGLIGEQELALRPLPIPEADEVGSPEALSLCESVQLFVDRAQIVRPDFQVTAGNVAAVAELCQRLEGIPLALELAAARCQVLTPAQILARLNNRLDFLVSRQPDRAPRHQTLRAAIDWSFLVLPDPIQRFFARLSVFRGGFTLEAAEAVCDEPLALDYLAELRECSLAQAIDQHDEDGGFRFRIMETLREYGEERLETGERARIEAAHAAFYLSLAESAEAELTGAGQGEALKRLEADHDNLRAALARFIQAGDAEQSLRMVGALGMFWGIRGHIREARERFDAVLKLLGEAQKSAAGAKARDLAGTFALNQGDFVSARRLYEESLALYRELKHRQGIADQLKSLGALVFEEGDFQAARSLWEESLSIYRELGNERSIAVVLKDVAYARCRLGEYDSGLPLFEESIRFFRESGRMAGAAIVLIYHGDSLREKGEYPQARPLCEESLQIFRDLGNQGGAAMALLTLADVLSEQGDHESADSHCRESLAIYREMEDRDGIADALYCRGKILAAQDSTRAAWTNFEEGLELHVELGSLASVCRTLEAMAELAVRQNQAVRASEIFAAAERLRADCQSVRSLSELNRRQRTLSELNDALGNEKLLGLRAEFQSLTPDAALHRAAAAIELSAQVNAQQRTYGASARRQ